MHPTMLPLLHNPPVGVTLAEDMDTLRVSFGTRPASLSPLVELLIVLAALAGSILCTLLGALPGLLLAQAGVMAVGSIIGAIGAVAGNFAGLSAGAWAGEATCRAVLGAPRQTVTLSRHRLSVGAQSYLLSDIRASEGPTVALQNGHLLPLLPDAPLPARLWVAALVRAACTDAAGAPDEVPEALRSLRHKSSP